MRRRRSHLHFGVHCAFSSRHIHVVHTSLWNVLPFIFQIKCCSLFAIQKLLPLCRPFAVSHSSGVPALRAHIALTNAKWQCKTGFERNASVVGQVVSQRNVFRTSIGRLAIFRLPVHDLRLPKGQKHLPHINENCLQTSSNPIHVKMSVTVFAF